MRYSVADAVGDYVDWLHRNRKSADDTKAKLDAYVLGSSLADKRLSQLTATDLAGWLSWALKRRRRTRKKAEAKERAPANKTEAAEHLRPRKATLNRIINPLKACLRYA